MPEAVQADPDGTQPEFASPFVESVRFADLGATSVVRAVVRQLSAAERPLPCSVWPEDGSFIVTKAAIVVEDVLCGPEPGDDVGRPTGHPIATGHHGKPKTQ